MHSLLFFSPHSLYAQICGVIQLYHLRFRLQGTQPHNRITNSVTYLHIPTKYKNVIDRYNRIMYTNYNNYYRY